jgi:tetratricopeptide (TPR) repeat protein
MHGLGLGLLLVVATSAPALAQQPGNTGPAKADYPTCNREIKQAESDAAHAKYLSGKVDYDEGKYESAIQNFRQAYDKDCSKHELLVIISRAYELNHNLPEAIKALEVYLERQPTSADAPTHKSRVASMKEKLADEKKKAAAAANASPGGPNGGGAPGSEGSQHTIYPWIVVGTGGAAILVGAILVVVGASNFPANCTFSDNTCTANPGETKDTASYRQRQDDAGKAKGLQIGGLVVVGAGAALAVGGLLWHFLEPTGPAKDSAKTKLTPQLGAGYGGFAITGRF